MPDGIEGFVPWRGISPNDSCWYSTHCRSSGDVARYNGSGQHRDAVAHCHGADYLCTGPEEYVVSYSGRATGRTTDGHAVRNPAARSYTRVSVDNDHTWVSDTQPGPERASRYADSYPLSEVREPQLVSNEDNSCYDASVCFPILCVPQNPLVVESSAHDVELHPPLVFSGIPDVLG